MRRRVRGGRQRGFLLVGLVTMMTVFGILSGVAVQEWSTIEKRAREQDLLYIQEQYASAVLEFKKDQGKFPAKLEELDQRGTKNQRFIRKMYVDPMTREATLADWCLLTINAGGQVGSSCTKEGEPGPTTRDGTALMLSTERSGSPAPPTAPGGAITTGVVGVQSPSSGQAFDVLRRGESTYNRWVYTFDDYQREMTARAVAVLNIKGEGPGLGGTPGGQQGPGTGLQTPASSPRGRKNRR